MLQYFFCFFNYLVFSIVIILLFLYFFTLLPFFTINCFHLFSSLNLFSSVLSFFFRYFLFLLFLSSLFSFFLLFLFPLFSFFLPSFFLHSLLFLSRLSFFYIFKKIVYIFIYIFLLIILLTILILYFTQQFCAFLFSANYFELQKRKTTAHSSSHFPFTKIEELFFSPMLFLKVNFSTIVWIMRELISIFLKCINNKVSGSRSYGKYTLNVDGFPGGTCEPSFERWERWKFSPRSKQLDCKIDTRRGRSTSAM